MPASPITPAYSRHFSTLTERVLFARHGRTRHNLEGLLQGSQDTSLAEPGQEDARRMADEAARNGVRLVVTSPLKRTRETAGIIAERNGLPVPTVIDDLHEYGYGVWEGQSKEALRSRPDRQEWFSGPVSAGERGIPEHGESYMDLLRRANAALERVVTALPGDGSVVAVAHSGILRGIRYLRTLHEQGVRELDLSAALDHEHLVFTGDARDTPHGVFRI